MTRILTRWIVDLKLDGFMFDAPDAELGAGIDGADHSPYNPALIRASMSDVIRNVSGGKAASFAEVYSDPPLLNDVNQLLVFFGFPDNLLETTDGVGAPH